MSISDRDRKMLWGRAGMRCSRCRTLLAIDETELDGYSIIGEECHIIGSKPTAARGELGVGRDDLDAYSNLILLCNVHHKITDDQPNTYTPEFLLAEKSTHEAWVTERLRIDGPEGMHPRLRLLDVISTGVALSDVVGGADAFKFSVDEPGSDSEAKTIADFCCSAEDVGNLWGMVGAGERVDLIRILAGELAKLEACGLRAYGCSIPGSHPMLKDQLLRIGVVVVAKSDSPSITPAGQLLALLNL